MAVGTTRSALMLRLEAGSARFAPVDDRWQRQVDELLTDLCIEVGPVVRERVAVRGAKGRVDSALLAVGSATTAGVVPFLQAWVARDRTRSLKVSWRADGTVHEVELRGGDVDPLASESLLLLLEKLGQSD